MPYKSKGCRHSANQKRPTQKKTAAPAGPRSGGNSKKRAERHAFRLYMLTRRLEQVALSFDPFDDRFSLLLELIEIADLTLPDSDLEEEPDNEENADKEISQLMPFVEDQLNWGWDLFFGIEIIEGCIIRGAQIDTQGARAEGRT